GVDCSYNNVGTITFDGKLNVDTLKSCFNTVIARHESLRTRFFAVDGQPLQAINQPYTVDLPVVELQSKDQIEHYAKQHGQYLFDLSAGKLMKQTLLKLSEPNMCCCSISTILSPMVGQLKCYSTK
ncbi:MAG: condensation domain-containing protein, partial [Psychrosphaera sp.]|nr:condensation domain-containing protein [Psychrosphaera sp.]